MSEPPLPSSNPHLPAVEDVEIKDAEIIFNAAWSGLEAEVGREGLCFPKEIILLGGAPGAGKGTNTDFIMKARGFTCPPIVVSSLLDSPEARRLKDRGQMVGDREVIGILLRKMLEPEFRDGAVLDGFPRTEVQVECMKLLVDEISALHREYAETPLAGHFRRPTIHVMVLFVDEKTSVRRQLDRGHKARIHNEEVRATGIGELLPERPTDMDEASALNRYRIFKEQTWEALQSLQEKFFYHFINATGSFEEVEENILQELKYQSSLELEPGTFEQIRGIPLASQIVVHARQDLVRRLDSYARDHGALFKRVSEVISEMFVPIIKRHAISGRAVVNTEDELFSDPLALAMLIDIFSERGFHAVVDKQLNRVPERVNRETGDIEFRPNTVYRIRIYFEGSEIRRG
ncbi:MAG: nucleoside monophosphate kinase [Akkermansiaceae bacterium]|nr:nucleoside monophosphate kinase [Akkermansiaceae bacterium]NNM27933.1 nucleoside monophosphate kinase [Akkermansiaceae bacterium]